jgi:hypothetical protein
MSDEDTSEAAVVATIEASCDERWGAWLSDTGQWWATRKQPLTAQQAIAGAVPYLRADTPDELMAGIREQDSLGEAAEGDTTALIRAPKTPQRVVQTSGNSQEARSCL